MHPNEFRPHHIARRVTPTDVRPYSSIYNFLEPGELLENVTHPQWKRWLDSSSPDTFDLVSS
jgi:hypothetical protein